jgi:hypothetical protein
MRDNRFKSASLGVGLILALVTSWALEGCSPQAQCPVCPRMRVVEPPPPPPPPPGQRRVTVKQPAWPMTCDVGMPIVARQAAAHLHLTELVGWYGHIRGEKSHKKTLFVGREQLISRRTLAYIKQCVGDEKDPTVNLAYRYLRNFLAMAYIERKTAHLDDQLNAAELGATVKLDWRPGKTAYRDLPGLLLVEKKPARRRAINQAMADVRRRVLNPLLIKKLTRGQELAQWMGYASYVALSSQVRQVQLKPLITLGAKFVRQSEPLFKKLMTRVANESLKVSLAKLRRSDHARLFSAPRVKRQLPDRLMIPTFKYFLQGIGLDTRTAAKTRIHIDDSAHPQKKHRAACYPLAVPSDIRITVKPAGGLSSWVTMFHEGGHALHFAWTTHRRWEFQQLGSYSLTEAFAELFARVWEDPAWLERYGKFIKEVRRGKHKNGLTKGLGRIKVRPLSKKLMGYLVRSRLAYNLYLARRYGWAKLIYEVALQGGSHNLFKSVYRGQTSDRRKLYKTLFQQAYGYKLSENDADRYLTDVDPFFYSADYARAFMLADILHEHLRSKFGRSWYGNKKVGVYLKTLWADGNRYTAEQIAAKLGAKLDYRASMARMQRLYQEAEVLSGRKPKRPRARVKAKPCKPKTGVVKCKIPI